MYKPREVKLYELPIRFMGGNSYPKIDVDANLKIKETLESISDFKKKLIYYNQNICSLSVYKMQPDIYYIWGNPDQLLKIFCSCQKCRKEPDFNTEHEKIYLSLRDKEVKRLVKGIADSVTYKDKIQYLFATKGYENSNRFTVHANVPLISTKQVNIEMFVDKPVIDLTPRETEERIIYNEYVKTKFDREYKVGARFTDKYNCFSFIKEKERLEEILRKSADQLKLLEYCKSDIENYFHYENGRDSTSKIVTRQSKIEDVMFARMVLGIDFDFNESKLNSYILFRYYHISEVAKFYKFLITRIKNICDPQPEFIQKKDKIELTIPDKMEKELALISMIFKSQHKKYDENEMFPYIFDLVGRCGIDGRYIHWMDIVSDIELMSLQKYKKHFTERFENTSNPSLVKSQLLHIRAKAIEARNYYNENLTIMNELVENFENQRKEWIDNFSQDNFPKGQKLIAEHHAVVIVSDFYTCDIYLGCDRKTCKGNIRGQYWYVTNNFEIANYCHKVVEFIDMFKLETTSTLFQESSNPTKLDYRPDELEAFVLKLTKLKGYESPSEYLDEMLRGIKLLNDPKFEDNFFLNIHNICKEHADKFWSESHRKDITEWLGKSRIVMFHSGDKEKIGFDTWGNANSIHDDVLAENTNPEAKITIPAYALMHVYLAMFQGQGVTQQNKTELAKQYGYKSGEQLRNDFTYYQNEDKRLDINLKNKRSAKTHLNRFEIILPLLEKQNLHAFQMAKKEFKLLEKEYNKYY